MSLDAVIVSGLPMRGNTISGIRTARVDQQRIHDRLKAAAEDYEVRYGRKKA